MRVVGKTQMYLSSLRNIRPDLELRLPGWRRSDGWNHLNPAAHGNKYTGATGGFLQHGLRAGVNGGRTHGRIEDNLSIPLKITVRRELQLDHIIPLHSDVLRPDHDP